MRKILITLSILIFVSVVATAQTATQDVKKASETKKECCTATASKDCPMMTAAKTDAQKPCCKEMATADNKEAAACKTKTEAGCCKGMTAESKTEGKKCDPAKCEMAKK